MKFWTLDEDHRPVPTEDVLAWGAWFVRNEVVRRVDHTQTFHHTVSTVFTGINHRYDDKGPPLLFETMVWDGDEWTDTVRYSSWDDALAGHAAMLRRVMAKEEAST